MTCMLWLVPWVPSEEAGHHHSKQSIAGMPGSVTTWSRHTNQPRSTLSALLLSSPVHHVASAAADLRAQLEAQQETFAEREAQLTAEVAAAKASADAAKAAAQQRAQQAQQDAEQAQQQAEEVLANARLAQADVDAQGARERKEADALRKQLKQEQAKLEKEKQQQQDKLDEEKQKLEVRQQFAWCGLEGAPGVQGMAKVAWCLCLSSVGHAVHFNRAEQSRQGAC